MQRLLVAALSITVFGTAALAQDTPPPPAPPAPAEQNMPDMGPGTTPPPPGPRHHEPKQPDTGFDIRMGDDMGLKVECGDQPLAECITAAQPLIDRLAPARN